MSQFDVYRNPSMGARSIIPYVVNIQSNLLDGLATRLTIPLGAVSAQSSPGPKALCPLVTLGAERLYVLPHLTVAFRVKDLGKRVGSLAPQAAQLISAIDAVLSGV